MDLISCEKCGAVIDTDRIGEPELFDHHKQELIYENVETRYSYPEAIIPCPVCECKIFYQDGEMAE